MTQKLIHSNPVQDEMIGLIELISNVVSTFDMSKFKDIDIPVMMNFMKKIASSKVKITPEYLSEMFKNVIHFDNKTSEIIDAKNEKIRALNIRIEELEKLVKKNGSNF